MALPQDGQNANALATVKEVPTGKKLIFVDPTTNEGGVITLEDLTTQILKNLTSQTFALDQGTKTLPAALNELNSNTSNIITVGNVSAGSVGTEFSSIDEAAQYIFDNKIPISENKLILVNFTFGYQYCMIVQKYYEGKWGAYILFGCNVPSISYHVKTDGEWK